MSIQELIHKMELGSGARFVWAAAAAAAILTLIVAYDLRAYQSFSSPEAMDAAQVAHNLSQGKGFSTLYLRPFSIHLVQKFNRAKNPSKVLSTNFVDFAKVNSPHPDLANAPVYPLVLAGLMKILPMDWKAHSDKTFWGSDGHFLRYEPEFCIALFNQLLLLCVVGLTFLLARKLFDLKVAWLAAVLTLLSGLLWDFSVSGLSTMLLLVIFLALALCLQKIEELTRDEHILPRKLFSFAVAVGALLGIGMLTRYAFGFLIVPVIIFLSFFGGALRTKLTITVALVFAAIITPWILRNYLVSGTLFGIAGYTVTELLGLPLMQMLNPNLDFGVMVYVHKFLNNLFSLVQNNLLRLGEGWMAILFFAGLMLGLRNAAGRRLRYFVMMCLGILIFAQALQPIAPEMSTSNLLALLTPFVIIFGVVFFLTLLNQMKARQPARYAIITLLAILVFEPLLGEIIFKKSSIAYPPYYPPEIQTASNLFRPDELMMSDVPWAVAWYGDHQCVSLTANANSEFYALNDYIKNVAAIYLTPESLDDKFFSDMARGGENSWPNFILKMSTENQFPAGFPLRLPHMLGGGLLLTDRDRWDNK